MGPLLARLVKRTGSIEAAEDAVSSIASTLGLVGTPETDEHLAGLALCARGESIEAVSKHLTWRDFERFCSSILRAKGYRVRENIYLRRPRAQVDVLGVSDRTSLAVDCKHWARASGRGALAGLVRAQLGRARRLHDSLDPVGPIAAVVLVAVDPGERFVEGGAVVPIFAFRDFLDSIEEHAGRLELV
ncbi:MAG: restriction endonuclease [Nitrososphaerota archaeon]|jgi:hypothetical protein|nr:restriction endonuclease [Nitrososphaerota archaeon]MDG6941903.1 restriction endonuclease [Nitrososphaerota archaeon]MDG6946924.1 restriction endonuclease [Nitrososphaerota archaeon]